MTKRYAEQAAACADRLLADARATGFCRLDDLALLYTVEVTAEVVGLESHPGMLARAEAARRRLGARYGGTPAHGDRLGTPRGRSPRPSLRRAPAERERPRARHRRRLGPVSASSSTQVIS